MDTQKVEDLVNLTSFDLMKLLDELRHQVTLAGCSYAELNKEYKDIKELLPSTLATIQLKYSSHKAAEAKVLALADAQYQGKIRRMNEAEYQMRLKEVEYRSLLKSIEALTSIGYVRNGELKLAR
jgi:hypothetical protein